MTDSTFPGHSLNVLYTEHHGWLKAWLRGKLDCADDAADLTQDTFVRVLRQREKIDALREPRAYLTTVARNLLFTHYQRRSLEQAYLQVLAGLPEELAPPPEHQALLLDTLHEVDALLSSLPRAVREAFLLVQLDGLSYEQVARRMKISVRTVQRYIVRAYELCILLPP